jgi:hypothetical protein
MFIKKWEIPELLSSYLLCKKDCAVYWVTSERELEWLSEISDWMTKESWFSFWQDKEISLLSRASRPALSTQPPIQLVLGV